MSKYISKFSGSEVDAYISKIINGEVVLENTINKVEENKQNPVTSDTLYNIFKEINDNFKSVNKNIDVFKKQIEEIIKGDIGLLNDVIGVDDNGDVFIKQNGDNPRNFYTCGTISFGGSTDNDTEPTIIANLSDLLDVSLKDITNGQSLVYENGYWVNKEIKTGLTDEEINNMLNPINTKITNLENKVNPLEARIAFFENIIGVDETTGDVYIKNNGDLPRNFYNHGTISFGGLSINEDVSVVNKISDLSDVFINNISANQILVWDTTILNESGSYGAWVNKDLEQGLNTEELSIYLKNNEYVQKTYVDDRITDLINGAPAAYDTLKEIADVLSSNVNSIGDIMLTLSKKADKGTTLADYGITDALDNTTKYALADSVGGNALNALKLGGQGPLYYATAVGLTEVSDRVKTLEDVIGIDKNGNVYIKDNNGNPRNFYTYGTISFSGLDIGSGDSPSTGNITISLNGEEFTTTNGYVELPSYPTALKNPYALTINGHTYDGSEAVNITISGGGGVADSVDWAKVYNKPTTLGGYGITDALSISGGTITRNDRSLLLLKNTNAEGQSTLWLGGDFETFDKGGFIAYEGKAGDVSIVNFKAYANNRNRLSAIRITSDNKVQVGNVNFTEGRVYDVIHSGNIGSYNAGSATKLASKRSIWGREFDGTSNIEGYLYLGYNRDTEAIIYGVNNKTLVYSHKDWTLFSTPTIKTFFDGSEFWLRGGNVYIGDGTANNTYLSVDGGIRHSSGVHYLGMGVSGTNRYVNLGDYANTSYNTITNINANKWTRWIDKSGTEIMSVDHGGSESYRLNIVGSLNATTIYQNGTTLNTLLGNYLPLSGGTIEGGFGALVVKRNKGYASGIRFDNTNGILGYIGIAQDGTAQIWDANQNAVQIIHSGNIGNQSVNYANSAGNAGSADVIGYTYGNQSINFANDESKLRLIKGASISNAVELGYPGNYFSGLSVMTDYTGWQMVTYGSIGEPNPYFRSFGDDGRRSDWRKLAFLTDNVASATKLQTGRYFWGNYFNGESDVNNYIFMNSGGEGIYISNSGISWHGSDNGWIASCMNFNSSGNVLIGTTDDNGAKLQVNGGMTLAGSYNGDDTLTAANIVSRANIYIPYNTYGFSVSYSGRSGGVYMSCGESNGSALYNMFLQPFGGNVIMGSKVDDGNKLQVNGVGRFGNAGSYGIVVGAGANSIDGVNGSAYNNGPLFLNYYTAGYLSLCYGGGNVLVGTTSDNGEKLQVAGNLTVTGTVVFGSDVRYKDIIENTSIDLETIANAPLFNYKWNDRNDEKIHLGTSAQYWYKTAFKNAVIPTNDEKLWTMGYAEIALGNTITLAKELIPIKKEVNKIKVLEERVKKLENILIANNIIFD